MNEWYDVSEKMPPVGASILAELAGCKVARFIFMTVREGEGLNHIKRWKYLEQYVVCDQCENRISFDDIYFYWYYCDVCGYTFDIKEEK